MKSINETISILRALEATIIDTQCDITDRERESLVRASFKTIVEDEVEQKTSEKGVAANG